MATIRAFRGLRPRKDLAEKVAELPYDVVSSIEAGEIAGNNQYSFFNIIKPEINLPREINVYDDLVYETGSKNFNRFIKDGVLLQDDTPGLYLYSQVMNNIHQTGLAACVNIDDYQNNIIKRHELTQQEKENDRTRHLDILNANTGPVFLFYYEDGLKKGLFEEAMKLEPEYDFKADDHIRHIIRVIDDKGLIEAFEKAFAKDTLYIADGHHRAASAAWVALKRRKENPGYSGIEEYNRFLAVIFPHDQLRILPYNRVVRDLNNMSKEEFFRKISKSFSIEKSKLKNPEAPCTFCMYLEGEWFNLVPLFKVNDHPIDSLDVKIFQKMFLEPVLGISDQRTDKRIKFIGGNREISELERIVDSGEFSAAFTMYPVTVNQLMRASDADCIMPPKSTWFEPKLRSGLLVHLLE